MDSKAWAIAIGLICMAPLVITAIVYGCVRLLVWLFGKRVEKDLGGAR